MTAVATRSKAMTREQAAEATKDLPSITLPGGSLTPTGVLYCPADDAEGTGAISGDFRSVLKMGSWFLIGEVNTNNGPATVLHPINQSQIPKAVLREHSQNAALRIFLLPAT
jgi:hypothetical protein